MLVAVQVPVVASIVAVVQLVGDSGVVAIPQMEVLLNGGKATPGHTGSVRRVETPIIPVEVVLMDGTGVVVAVDMPHRGFRGGRMMGAEDMDMAEAQ